MQFIRILLLPFSWIYGLASKLLEVSHNEGLLEQSTSSIESLCIGNLSVGGTGKTPHVHFFNELLSPYFSTGIVSRGYGRKSNEVLEVTLDKMASETGDEPLELKEKLPQTPVVVARLRGEGIHFLTQHYPKTNLILLDDAMQHWKFKASHYILLSTFDQPFFSDAVLPAGRLREFKSGYRRATIIIVTKCPLTMTMAQKKAYLKQIAPTANQHVFFSSFIYGHPYALQQPNQSISIKALQDKPLFLSTGIAKPKLLLDYLKSVGLQPEISKHKDHHNFSIEDVKSMEKWHQKTKGNLLCTAKDATKLKELVEGELPFFVLPVAVAILFEEEASLKKALLSLLN